MIFSDFISNNILKSLHPTVYRAANKWSVIKTGWYILSEWSLAYRTFYVCQIIARCCYWNSTWTKFPTMVSSNVLVHVLIIFDFKVIASNTDITVIYNCKIYTKICTNTISINSQIMNQMQVILLWIMYFIFYVQVINALRCIAAADNRLKIAGQMTGSAGSQSLSQAASCTW